ncbi:hypothetical protein, partial [Clavibacter michiganensis]|uniref:hypothetical protein n=1 Tax=Clavibacter michiganensis TaxID=28447 RepID=UPI0013654417
MTKKNKRSSGNPAKRAVQAKIKTGLGDIDRHAFFHGLANETDPLRINKTYEMTEGLLYTHDSREDSERMFTAL